MQTKRNRNRKVNWLWLALTIVLGSGGGWWGLHKTLAAPEPAMAALTVTSTGDTQVGAPGCADGCTLREAIAAASAGDEIRFSALFNTPQTITLGGTELTINKNLTITGPGANLLTISGNQASRVFYINSSLSSPAVALNGLTIANGKITDDQGGGIYINDGFVNITNCTISGNTSFETPRSGTVGSVNIGGAGIYNFGFLMLTNSTVSGNLIFATVGLAAYYYGAGIRNDYGVLTLTNSTVYGNMFDTPGGARGGGIYSGDGLVTITNSTISGNQVATFDAKPIIGAGIYNYRTTLNLTSSTITGNGNVNSLGSGVYKETGTVNVRNTIIAANIGVERAVNPSGNCPDVSGGLTSQGHNLIGKGNCSGLTNGNNSDQVGTIAAPLVPMLGPLASNGGPTQTHAPLAGSPAINAGDNCVTQTPGCLTTPLTTDQRGAGFPRQLGGTVDIGAFESSSSSCQNNPIVTANADSGAGSLREAIANVCPGSAITFNLPANATITLTSGQLVIDKNLTITGPGANLLTISGNQASRVFNLNSGVTATIGGLTMSGGNGQGAAANGNGGAIANFGDLTLRAVHLTNSTASMLGGGIYAEGPLTIEHSAITNNTAKIGTPSGTGIGAAGGGIHSENATLTLTNTTVSGNRSVAGEGDNGGGVWSTGTTTITACTITDNEGYGIDSSSGVSAYRGTVTIRDSIVAANRNNTSIPDVLHNGGEFVSGGHNLIGNPARYDAVAFNQPGDQIGTAASPRDPRLSPLANNGGPTPTHRLLSGSPAINAGDDCVTQTPGCLTTPLTTDQRGAGFPRKVGAAVDIGAFEYSCVTNPVVTTNADSGAGSLRDAIANACPGSTITFNLPANSTITLTTGELVIDKNLTINGPGANLLTISGNQASRVFNINSGVTATLDRLTIANGRKVAVSLDGGGGIRNSGNLTLTNSTISGNSTDAYFGGGIFNYYGTLMIMDCTISGNSVGTEDGGGGGLLIYAGSVTIMGSTISSNFAHSGGGIFILSGSMTIMNSTISGNSADSGGGIFSASIPDVGGCSVTLINSTISGNSARQGGGIHNNDASLTLTSSTISGNSASFASGVFIQSGSASSRNTLIAGNSFDDIFGPFTSQGYNLIGRYSNSTGFTNGVNHDQVGTVSSPIDPRLGPLASNGGPTQTHRPLPGSPAINAGDNCVALNPGCLTTSLTTDQRGFNRQIGSAVDIGAVEVNYTLAATGGTPQSTPLNTAFTNLLQATLNESGLPAGGAQLTFNAPNSGPSAMFPNGSIVTTNGNGQANVLAIANGSLGSYQVTASAGELSPVTFNLTNICPTITLAALSGATAGLAYNQMLTASPAGGNYSFALVGGSTLPPGLSLAASGAITGTPSQAGTFNFNVVVTGFAGGCTGTLPVPLTVVCPTINLNPATLPNGEAGTAYNQTLTASPAGGNYSFAVTSGTLPSGVSLNPSTGLLSGTPAQTGNFSFRVTATGFGACAGFRDYQLVVPGCAPITINPVSLSSGTVGAAYSASLSATPAGAYSFAVTSGALPPGLTLNAANGSLTGTPPTAGTFNFRVTATSGSCAGARDYSVTINCAGLTLGTLPNGTAGSSYNQTISVSPAAPAGSYSFSLAQGNLPSGLSLNPTTGAISGMPTVTGSYSFTVKAQATGGCAGTQSYALQISCPTVTLSTLATPSLNSPYNQTVTASPSGGNYTFTVTAGAVPTGLSLNPATGAITGTPTTAGAYNFTITASAFSGGSGTCTGNRTYTGTIGGGGCPSISLPDLPGGQPAQLYNQSLAASPGGSYNYAVTSGSLPPGLTLYGNLGMIFGYPTAAGTYNFTVTATDANNCTGSKQYSLNIGGAALRSLTFGDFDGDGKADLSVWRGQAGDWLTLTSSDGNLKTEAWGSSAAPYFDVMTPGDFDGDGKMDLAVFRRQTGQWLIKGSRDGAVTAQVWGLATDTPVPGDYDGDGKTDLAVWRGAESNWYIQRSSDGQTETVSWGTSRAPYRDLPVPADYDGDGKTDIAIFRQSNGHWYIRLSSDGSTLDKVWGLGTDIPVAADYDGDGKADIAVWRGADANWYILRSSDEQTQSISWGTSSLGDVPAPTDYDGDGKADAAVWRASSGTWLVKTSRDGAVKTIVNGQHGDLPLTSRP